MKTPFSLFVLFCFIVNTCYSQTIVNAELDFSAQHPISSLIYGYNQDHQNPNGIENWAIRRLGGNRMTGFNWENGASNSGHDNAGYTNDNRIPSLVGVPWQDRNTPGEVYKIFHQDNLEANVNSIITVPILGYVAADKEGSNLTSPPSVRWNELVYKKNGPFTLAPDDSDGKVYLDESIDYLVQTFGNSTSISGVKYISLDNEPALWDNTHNFIQQTVPTIDDYIQKVIDAAKAVKAIDRNIKIITGEFAGINIYDFGNIPDWQLIGNDYDWFPSYFLDQLKKASDIEGYPLIDILSFHNYPQHKIDANGNFNSSGTQVRNSTSTEDHIRSTRMDFPRSLWDDNYIEPSWLTGSKLNGAPNKILVRMQNSIDQYFPGTKLMIGEFDYGHDLDISHGIGIADFLGVVGQYNVEITTRWDGNPNNNNSPTYTSLAYQLYRNYDGFNSTFGDISIKSAFNNANKASVWASLDSDDKDLHMILINKEIALESTIEVALTNTNNTFVFKDLKKMDSETMAISSGDQTNIIIENGKIISTLPPLSVYHLILKNTTLGVDHYRLQDVKIYPLPFEEKVTIEFPEQIEDVTTLKIINLQGQVIKKIQQNKFEENRAILNLQSISKGVYILKMNHNGDTVYKKIIKK